MTAEPSDGRDRSGQRNAPTSSLADELRGVDLDEVLAKEIAWLTSHAHEAGDLIGQWIALDNDVLLSHNEDLAVVLREATEAGCLHPLIAKVDDPGTVIVG